MSAAEAEAVLEFARTGRLFFPDPLRDPTDALIIADFARAHELATSQPEFDSPWVDWTDLREHQAGANCWPPSGASATEQAWFKSESSRLASALGDVVYERLRLVGLEKAGNEVSADLWLIAKSRLKSHLSRDAGSPFWERVFSIYAAGYWPCGWVDGVHPSGRFAAFRPGG